jgi:hypothetical protein
VQTALGGARYEAALDEGKKMSLDQAIAYAATTRDSIDVWLSRPGAVPI